MGSRHGSTGRLHRHSRPCAQQQVVAHAQLSSATHNRTCVEGFGCSADYRWIGRFPGLLSGASLPSSAKTRYSNIGQSLVSKVSTPRVLWVFPAQTTILPTSDYYIVVSSTMISEPSLKKERATQTDQNTFHCLFFFFFANILVKVRG